MTDNDRDTLELVKELHSLGATHVRVRDVEARFDRVFVPLKAVPAESFGADVIGETESLTTSEVQAMRDELESLREMKRAVEALGVV